MRLPRYSLDHMLHNAVQPKAGPRLREDLRMSDKESVVYGPRAVTALAQHRPGDLRRVLFSKSLRNHIGPILKTTAKQRKPYREVEKDDLDRVSGTPHHEGIVAIAKPLSTRPFGTMKETLMSSRCIIAVDTITNPTIPGRSSEAWLGLVLRRCSPNRSE